MKAVYPVEAKAVSWLHGRLGDQRLSIGGPRFDALLLWGCPLASALFVMLWVGCSDLLSPEQRQASIASLAIAVSVLTFAHLIAVVPRAYLNREVFEAYRLRLTWVPIFLILALLASPALLICAGILAVFWDVHHSAMQTFGLARIYDMKAGNSALTLRRTDMRLNWFLYVGPIAAGASLMAHLASLKHFGRIGWSTIVDLPSVAQSHSVGIRETAVAACVLIVLWAAWDYREAIARGYRLPVHKAALIGSAAFISILAWGFMPPVEAFIIINLFHAVQYFALVWLKEGGRIGESTARLTGLHREAPAKYSQRWAALALFLILCLAFGIAYQVWRDARWLAGPFIACSLLHFWYDSFVWSVRKKQV